MIDNNGWELIISYDFLENSRIQTADEGFVIWSELPEY